MFWKKIFKGGSDRCTRCRGSNRFTPIELRFYRQMDVEPPKLCRKCRQEGAEAASLGEERPRVVHGK